MSVQAASLRGARVLRSAGRASSSGLLRRPEREPTGEVALGGSTRVEPSLTTLGLQVARPDFTLGRFHARAARAGDSTSTDWQLRGSATCFRNNGNFHVGTILCCHERAVKTVTVVDAASTSSSSAARSVTVDADRAAP